MERHKLVMIKILMVILFSTQIYADIPIVGIDENGFEIDQSISEDSFLLNMDKSLNASLELLPQKENLPGNFVLEKISIGFGAHGEIGLGPFKIGGTIRHRYLYLRSDP